VITCRRSRRSLNGR